MKKVYVVWEDVGIIDDGTWAYREGLAKGTPFIFHQVGFLFELTPEYVTLTDCVGKDMLSPRNQIPAALVKSLVELTEGQPVKIPKKRTKAKA